MEVFAYQNILLNAQLLEDYWEGHFAILLLFDDQSLITKKYSSVDFWTLINIWLMLENWRAFYYW